VYKIGVVDTNGVIKILSGSSKIAVFFANVQ